MKTSEAALYELETLTTRDEAGRHFTEWSSHYEELESAGLIAIRRPVHAATGLSYRQEDWAMEVTEKGVEACERFESDRDSE